MLILKRWGVQYTYPYIGTATDKAGKGCYTAEVIAETEEEAERIVIAMAANKQLWLNPEHKEEFVEVNQGWTTRLLPMIFSDASVDTIQNFVGLTRLASLTAEMSPDMDRSD